MFVVLDLRCRWREFRNVRDAYRFARSVARLSPPPAATNVWCVVPGSTRLVVTVNG